MTIPNKTTERQFTREVIKAAELFGWMVHHVPYYSQNARPKPGFPDLVLLKPPKLIFAELKTAKGKLTEHQKNYIQKLRQSGQEAYVWRHPKDWDEILKILSREH